MRKLLKTLAATVVCLGAVYAYGETQSEDKNGATWYYTVDGSAATITRVSSHVPNDLVVPATLGGNPVVTIGRAVFSYTYSNLTSITFPDSLREIVEKNFDSSPNLTNVTFGTGMEVLGYDVFADKTRILQFTIPEGNPNFSSEGGILYSKDKTVLVRYAESATSFEIPDTVTVIGDGAFYYHDDLEHVTFPAGLKEIRDNAFYCNFKLDIPALPSGLTVIGNAAFRSCYEIKSVAIPDGVAEIGSEAFNYCEKLSSLTIGSGVGDIGKYAFGSCLALVKVVIPPSVTNIQGDAFTYCTNLVDVTIGSGVARLGSGGETFVDDWGYEYREESSPAFGSCDSLVNFKLAAGNATFEEIGGCLYFRDTPKMAKKLAAYPSGRKTLYFTGDVNVTELGIASCSRCDNFVDITIPDTVREIGFESMIGCASLEKLTIPAGPTNISEGAFMLNMALYDVEIAGTVKTIGALAFQHENMDEETEGRRLVLHEGIESIGAEAFSRGRWIHELVVPNSVTSLAESAFAEQWMLKKVELGTGVTALPVGLLGGCYELESVTMNGAVASVGDNAFTGCEKLVGITLDNAATIGENAFNRCENLVRVDLGVNLTSVGEGAFQYCYSLPKVILPPNVAEIGDKAFNGGTVLEKAYLPAALESTIDTASVFSSCPGLGSGGIVFYGAEDVPYATVTLNANGGKCIGVDSVLRGEGDTLGTLPTAAYEGNTFDGWFTAAEGGEAVTAETPVAGDATYYAHWTGATPPEPPQPVDPDGIAINTESSYTTESDGTFTLVLPIVSATTPKVTVKGLPSGITFTASTLTISGKAKAPGVATVTVSATNAKVKTPVTATFELKVPNFTTDTFKDAGLDTDGKYVLGAGAAPDLAAVIAAIKDGGWKLAVAGLPAGLKYDDKNSAITGVATKEGFFTVTFTATQGKTKEIATATFEVVFPALTLDIAAYGEDASATNKAKVVGGGKYPVGAKVTLKATPDKGKVFAGWFDAEGNPLAGAADYRTASFPYVATDADVTLKALFAKESEDIESLKVTVTDAKTDDDGAYELDLGACVASASLPKLAVKGLPTGLKFDTKTLKIAGKATKPGVYLVKVEATNTSVKKATPASTGEFKLTVPNFTCAALPKLKAETDAYGTNFAGVAFDPTLVDCTPAEGWTVKVAGLPAGLKYDAKTGKIAGVSTAKPGSYTVTFTATKGKEKQEATITLNVEALPDWAVGTFDGPADGGGIVQALTIAANGKISGKVLEGGNTWALSAVSFDSYDAGIGAYLATVVGKNGKLLATNFVAVTEGADGTGVASCDEWTAWQNLWKRADTKGGMPIFKASFDRTVELGEKGDADNSVKLTFKKDGVVSFAGKVGGAKVSGSSQLVNDGTGWSVTLYAPPKAPFDGWSKTFDVALTTDEKNVVTDVTVETASAVAPLWAVGEYVGYGNVYKPNKTGLDEYLYGMLYVDVAEDLTFTGRFEPVDRSGSCPFSGKFTPFGGGGAPGYQADRVTITVKGVQMSIGFSMIYKPYADKEQGYGEIFGWSNYVSEDEERFCPTRVWQNVWKQENLAEERPTFAEGTVLTIEPQYEAGDSLNFAFSTDGKSVAVTGQVDGKVVDTTATIGVEWQGEGKCECYLYFMSGDHIYSLTFTIPSSGVVTKDDIILDGDLDDYFGLVNAW